MCALALESDRRSPRTPRFVADLAELSAIYCVSELCSEAFDVKLLDTRSDFFIRRESDSERAALDLWILFEGIDHGHDFGNARLVIRTEQCRAIGSDDVVANQVLQLGILRGCDYLRLIFRQDNVSTLVVFVKDRIDVLTRHRRRRVH